MDEPIFNLEPSFDNAITLIAMNCGITRKPKSDWPDQLDVDRMDRLCKRMDTAEFETFVIGEHSEAQEVSEKHGLHDLHSVLNRAYEGDLSEHFFD